MTSDFKKYTIQIFLAAKSQLQNYESFETDARLGCDVVGCTTESDGQFVAAYLLFAHTEVRQFDVTLFVEQHVVQFQISATTRTPLIQIP